MVFRRRSGVLKEEDAHQLLLHHTSLNQGLRKPLPNCLAEKVKPGKSGSQPHRNAKKETRRIGQSSTHFAPSISGVQLRLAFLLHISGEAVDLEKSAVTGRPFVASQPGYGL